MVDFIEPLDLQNILVNTLSGSTNIFIFLSIIVISYMAGKFRMNNSITLIMLSLYAIIMANFIGTGFYGFAVIFIAIVASYGLGRFIKY